MNITELIKELEDVRNVFGDIDVVTADNKPIVVVIHQDVSGISQGKQFFKVVKFEAGRE